MYVIVNGEEIQLRPSSTVAPTLAPTLAPTFAPTFPPMCQRIIPQPTRSRCGGSIGTIYMGEPPKKQHRSHFLLWLKWACIFFVIGVFFYFLFSSIKRRPSHASFYRRHH